MYYTNNYKAVPPPSYSSINNTYNLSQDSLGGRFHSQQNCKSQFASRWGSEERSIWDLDMADGGAYRQLTEQEYSDLGSALSLSAATVRHYFSSERAMFGFKVADLKTIFKILLPGVRATGNKTDLVRVLVKRFVAPTSQPPPADARPVAQPAVMRPAIQQSPFSLPSPFSIAAAPPVTPQAILNEDAAAMAQSPFYEVVERLAALPFWPKTDSRPFSAFSGIVDVSESVLTRVRPRTAANAAYQIQVRFFTGSNDAQWLIESNLKVNNQICDLKNVFKKIKTASKQPFIIPRLPDISQLIWQGRNKIEFVTFDRQQGTVIVQLVKSLSIEEVMAKVPHNGQASPKAAPKSGVAGDELEELSSLISLRCPLMCGRVEIPAKGRDCVHVACFDLKTYLMFANQQQTWHCPICSNKLPFKNLLIDDFIANLISTTNSETMQVRLEADGTYQPFDPDAIIAARKKLRTEAAKAPTALVDLEDDTSSPRPTRGASSVSAVAKPLVPVVTPAVFTPSTATFTPLSLPLVTSKPAPAYPSYDPPSYTDLHKGLGPESDDDRPSSVVLAHLNPTNNSNRKRLISSNGSSSIARSHGTSEDPFVKIVLLDLLLQISDGE